MNRLIPRSPLRPVRAAGGDLFEEFDRLRSQLLDTLSPPEERLGGWFPAAADLEEKDDEYVVNVEVPGFDREDIRIEMEGRRLIVHAEREVEQPQGIMRSSTRNSTHLHHEVLLPSEVDAERVHASMDRGVLTIRAPKTADTSRRQIEISS